MGELARRLERAFMSAAERAVYDVAQEVLEQAKRDAPPTNPEDDPDPNVNLRETGHVRRLRGERVAIVFDAPHAAKQHEDLRLEHPHGGGPKYLERNVLAAAAALRGRIAGEIRALTGEHVASGGRRHTKRF